MAEGILKIKKRTFGGNSLISLLEYVLMFFVVINITCIWLRFGYGLSHLSIFQAFVPITALLLAAVKVVFYHRTSVRWGFLMHFALISIGILVSVVGDFSTLGNAFFRILVPLLSFLTLGYLSGRDEIESLLMKFVNIMFVLAIVSLFFYLMCSVFHIISPTGIIQYEWDSLKPAKVYFHIYYEPEVQMSDSLFQGMSKNCGIFTEGTMYGYMLVMAYIFLRRTHQKKLLMQLVFIAAILSTLSTMPILSLLIFEAVSFITTKKNKRILEVLRILLIPVVIIVFTVLFMQTMTAKMTTGSFNVRSDHLEGCIQAFVASFPFGVGFGNRDYIFHFCTYQQGLSVGIPYFIALGGLGALLVVIVPTVKYLYYSIIKHEWTELAFAISFIWMFFCTNIVYNSTLQWLVLTMVFLREGDFLKNSSQR